jgi:hypothetical protein
MNGAERTREHSLMAVDAPPPADQGDMGVLLDAVHHDAAHASHHMHQVHVDSVMNEHMEPIHAVVEALTGMPGMVPVPIINASHVVAMPTNASNCEWSLYPQNLLLLASEGSPASILILQPLALLPFLTIPSFEQISRFGYFPSHLCIILVCFGIHDGGPFFSGQARWDDTIHSAVDAGGRKYVTPLSS